MLKKKLSSSRLADGHQRKINIFSRLRCTLERKQNPSYESAIAANPKFMRYSSVWVLQEANVQHTDFCFPPKGHSCKSNKTKSTTTSPKTFLETVFCQAKVHLVFALDKGRQ